MSATTTKCCICGCTYERGCPGICSWAHKNKGEEPICSVCATMRDQLADYDESCLRVTAASLARLLSLGRLQKFKQAMNGQPKRRNSI